MLDTITCNLILDTLAKRDRREQFFFQRFTFNEWGGLIVTSKEETIQILNDPDSTFERKVAALIFAEGYKKVINIATRAPTTTRAEVPTLNRPR